MTPALDDVLLVLLGERPYSAQDLRQRHATLFGDGQAVDLGRVTAALNRLERSGHLRIEAAAPARRRHRNRRTYVLTVAGQHRQRSWLTEIPAGAGVEDVQLRGMLAVEVADPSTFDAFLGNSLDVVRRHQREIAADGAGHPPAVRARLAYAHELSRALVLWLHQLPNLRRP